MGGPPNVKFVFAVVAAGTAALAFKVGTATGNTPIHVPGAMARADVKPVPTVPVRAKRKPRLRKPGEAPPSQIEALNDVVQFYCTDCHSDDNKSTHGNLSLEHFDLTKAASDPHTSELVIRKLRAQMMPPPGILRPKGDTLSMIVSTVEKVVDKAAKPNAGTKTFQRLNRAEYENAIRDLFGLEIDAGDFLPLDTKSANFDNIADVQSLSATLLESYLNAAAAVSRMAVGDKTAAAIPVTYTASPFTSQHPWDHIEGTPFGTRGGVVADHVFPADGTYLFTMKVDGGVGTKLEDIDISIDGKRAALLKYEGGVNRTPGSADLTVGEDLYSTDTLHVTAGQHRVAAAFVRRTEGPYEDLIRPHEWSMASDGNSSVGTTSPPHIRDITVTGPKTVTGVSESPSRKKVFSCRPSKTLAADACAEQILDQIGTRAYRRPLTQHDRDGLMQFYKKGAANGDFEQGVRLAIQAMLSNPAFVFRFEPTPANATPGQDYKISDLDLASRLSFFLWGSIPDDQLLTLAKQNRLSQPAVLKAQVKRLLADPRSEALSTRFASQWLRLQDLDKVHPDAFWFPDFNQELADNMRRETQLFFDDIVKSDKNILTLLTANYTFVNERLARHYGIPNVAGDHFRKVMYPDSTRRGILGQGSMLVQTSVANRTSPVLRGKWVMEVLLGSPPPPPPPNIPTLDETADGKGGHPLTTRERMEMHRKAATCRSCHNVIDPIGLALDNFDVTGRWRYNENGAALDTHGQLYDGTPVQNLPSLVDALVKRPIPLVRTFTENLMAYALGRRVEDFDEPTVRAIAASAAANDYKFSTFVNGIVNSTAFRSKRADVVSADMDNKQDQHQH
jgi:uncharacterized protein DUF1592/uncharacterized protein DUF1588/uncharacterized protein DUF1587/uncharacterized protein DUF1595/uncharacterized protein DUF1585/cytochrome c